jgi:capsular exopolysaccharide synthesis family protein
MSATRDDQQPDLPRLDLPEPAALPDGPIPASITSRSAPPADAHAPMTPAYAAAPAYAVDEVHLLDYVRVLYKRRWTAATAFLLVVLGVTVYTFTATPIFEAKTQLLIESDDPNVVSFQEVINEEQAKADYYQTQYNILRSRALARKTIDALGLWNSPHLGGGVTGRPAGIKDVVFGIGGGIGSMFGGSAAATVKDPDETEAQSKTIDAFLRNLTVSPIRNSRLVDVKYRLPDAAAATAIVNTLAKNYIEQNLEYKFMASKEASDWLGERLAEQRQQVESAEARLQQYREQTDSISLEHRENIVVQKLADLNAAVTQARTDRFQKQALYNQLQGLGDNRAALDTFPAILSNTFIQQQKAELSQLQSQFAQLSEKMGERHPEILKVKSAIELAQTKLDGEIGKVVQSVKNEYQAALAKENSLVGALNQQKGEAQSMNRKAIDYGVLQRDVESNKQLYESLLQRAKETGVSSELKTSNIRVVDQAERPSSPVSPRKALNLMLGLFGGGLFAFGLAFFFEYIDSRIKTPEELKIHLGLPSLGMVPALDVKECRTTEPLISKGVPPNFAEAYRSVRTNVLFSSAEEGGRALVVTSTGPGEGKTTVAANLAISLAQAGQRVLLVDADMRRPRVHEVFNETQEPGLSNVLVGNAKASDSVKKSGVPGLWLLTAGHIPPNAAELLGSKRFREFLGQLQSHFDCVIVDTPPVMAVTDAAVAANIASGVLFVVGAEMTTRHAAREAVDQLERSRARFLGAVLNRVEIEKNAYYYSHYYRREYGAYYHCTGEHRV